MIFSMVVMALIILLMLVGGLPAPGGGQAVIFGSPVFVALCALLCGALLSCCWRRRRSGRRRIVFLVLHLGVSMILIGGFIGFVAGRRTNVVLPLDGRQIAAFQTADQQSFFTTGFSVAASDFDVEFYDPAYFLYRPPAGADDDYEFVKKIQFRDGKLDLGNQGEIAVTQLRNHDTGEWLYRKLLDNGWMLQRANPVARRYGAQLHFKPDGQDVDAPRLTRQLAVNQPADYRGWRFYLMSYDVHNKRYIVITMRRDPGRKAVIAGIWLAMIGTAISCLRLDDQGIMTI